MFFNFKYLRGRFYRNDLKHNGGTTVITDSLAHKLLIWYGHDRSAGLNLK